MSHKGYRGARAAWRGAAPVERILDPLAIRRVALSKDRLAVCVGVRRDLFGAHGAQPLPRGFVPRPLAKISDGSKKAFVVVWNPSPEDHGRGREVGHDVLQQGARLSVPKVLLST